MKEKYKDVIGTDSQGWPLYKLNLRDILIQLGANIVNGRIGFDENNCILDIYPTRLIDDGMGYGVGEQYVVDAEVFQCENEEPIIHIWTEPQHPKEEIDQVIQDFEYIDKKREELANKN